MEKPSIILENLAYKDILRDINIKISKGKNYDHYWAKWCRENNASQVNAGAYFSNLREYYV
jgi:hypothetical protein